MTERVRRVVMGWKHLPRLPHRGADEYEVATGSPAPGNCG